MSSFLLNKVSKKYQINNNEYFYALKNISFSLPSSGFISIVGKSGCGKSTLLNILGGLDEASEGEIRYENNDIKKFKHKRMDKFHNEDIGILFQHYHLLEDETSLYNVMLPNLIRGDKVNKAKENALALFRQINFDESLINKKVSLLSGGEKQRVSFLRAMSNSPKVLLCDEPTGALDSKNAVIIMDLLKMFSQSCLVILVSHNLDLVHRYSDRIITLNDGRIIEDKLIHEIKTCNKEINHKHNPSDKYINHLLNSNIKRRKKRNLFSIISLVIGLTFSLLSIGFSFGYKKSISNASLRQFNYGVLRFSKEKQEDISDSNIKIIQENRPSIEETYIVRSKLNQYRLDLNFSTLVPENVEITDQGYILEDLFYSPIYSYNEEYVDKSLLIEGQLPLKDSLNEIVINKKGKQFIEKKTKKDCLNLLLTISYSIETSYFTGDTTNPVIYDVFNYKCKAKIVGVVDELDFLSSPRIYYSYSALTKHMINTKLTNLSVYKNEDISWYQRIEEVSNGDHLSSYSYLMFVPCSQFSYMKDDIKLIDKPLSIASNAITIKTTLLNLINAMSMGMNIFVFIGVIGTFLILGISSFSSYVEDKKRSAILSSMGASKSSINSLFIYENLLLGICATIVSIIISIPLSKLINLIVYKMTSYKDMIYLPYLSFLGHRFFFILIIILLTFLTTLIFTGVPIILSKKISIKDELQSL